MRKKRKTNKIIRALCILLVMASFLNPYGAFAAPLQKSMSLTKVKSLALQQSDAYQKIKSKILLKQAEYQAAVKSIALKKKKLSTFKWSPLLSFKFPEKATLDQEFEFMVKPQQIQTEITSLKHEQNDVIFEVYEEACNLFVELYTFQEQLAFHEKRLEAFQETLRRNQARLLTGEGNQADVESMEKAITALKDKIAAQTVSFETNKADLSDMIHLDVRSGYSFQDPLLEAKIDRKELKGICDYTLENAQGYFETKLNTRIGFLSLDTNYKLMKAQYGSKMEMLDPYVDAVKQGFRVDSAAFKLQYDAFLKKIDDPWNGKIKILFIKIPKEWFKGEISGVRYVEDDPTVLYNNALEYYGLLTEEEKTKKDLIKEVETGFSSLVSVRNAYTRLAEEVEKAEKDVLRAMTANSLGEMTYEEVSDTQSAYEEVQMDMLDAMAEYSQTLFSYDRLTCGAISRLLEGNSLELNSVGGGDSYLIEDIVEGASYYIKNKVEDNVFDFGIYIPQEYSLEITDFELWCNGYKIGDRTKAGDTVRHLTLSVKEVESAFVRLYNGETFVDDCNINPEVYNGPLEVVGGYIVEQADAKVIGSYHYTTDSLKRTTELTLQTEPKEGLAYYKIKTKDKSAVYGDKLYRLDEKFVYLSLIQADLGTLTIELYDEGKTLKYEAGFNTEELKIEVKQ